jgi:Fe-S-cluster containining protein
MDDGVGTSQAQAMARGDAFAYRCQRCLNCCRDKRIQLNPYEVARLARNRGVGTGEFRQRWAQKQGTELKRQDDGACIFLEAGGCAVHADRPLVCRLYPLGRQVMPDGSESFMKVTPHPDSTGLYGGSGDIADYLDSQGAGPFMRAADAYYSWRCRAQDALNEGLADAALPAGSADEVLDMDAAIARHCAAAGIAEPADSEARLALHLRILDQLLSLAQKPSKRGEKR